MQPESQQDGSPAPVGTPVQPASQPPVAQPVQQPQPVAPVQPTQPVQPLQQPQPVAVEAMGAVAVSDQVEDGFGYDPGDTDEEYDDEEIDLTEPVKWEASEYIHQEKDAKWFILFAVVIAAFMAIAVLLMQSWTFAVLLVVIAIMVVVLAKRPPRVMEYALSNEGLHIGQTLHKFSDFKSFGIIRDGEEFSVMLIPRRRLQPGITVYFPEEAGEDIVDALGSRLPMKDLNLDVVDRLVRKLRL